MKKNGDWKVKKDLLSRKNILIFALTLVVLFFFTASVVEAASFADIKSDFKNMASKNFTKQRMVNYLILSIVLIGASMFFFKDNVNDSQSKALLWVGCVIFAVIIILQTTAPTQYVWQKPVIQDTSRYLFGTPLDGKLYGTSAGCDGDGAYYDVAEKDCRQGILRTNGGKGLPALAIALIVLALVFNKWRDVLGLAENKKLRYLIVVILAAIITNGGVEQGHLITIGGWLVILILFFTLKSRMGGKEHIAFALAFGAIETLVNLFESSLMGLAPDTVGMGRVVLNFFIGFVFASIYHGTLGEKGVIKHALGNLKKSDYKQLYDDGRYFEGFVSTIPILGHKRFRKGLRDFFTGLGIPLKKRKKQVKVDLENVKRSVDTTGFLEKEREKLKQEFEKLRKPYKAELPDIGGSLFEEIMKSVGKLDKNSLGDRKNVEKAILKVLTSKTVISPDRMSEILAGFVKPFVEQLYSLKKGAKSFISLLKLLKFLEEKEEESKEPEPFDISDLSAEKLKKQEEKLKQDLIKEFNGKVKKDYQKLAKGTGLVSSINVETLIDDFHRELNYLYINADELKSWVASKAGISNFQIWEKVIPDDKKKSFIDFLNRTEGLFARYANGLRHLHQEGGRYKDLRFENMSADNIPDDWEQRIKDKKEATIDYVADKILQIANHFRRQKQGVEDFESNHIIAPNRLRTLEDARKRAKELFNAAKNDTDGVTRKLYDIFATDLDLGYIDVVINARVNQYEHEYNAAQNRSAKAEAKSMRDQYKAYQDRETKKTLIAYMLNSIFSPIIPEVIHVRSVIDAKESEIIRSKTVKANVFSGDISKGVSLIPMSELLIVSVDGEDAESIPLSRKVITIGSGDSSDLRIFDNSGIVSGEHARIIYTRAREYRIFSLSRSSTYVNGRKVESKDGVTLKPGYNVRFGSDDFEFVTSDIQDLSSKEWKSAQVFNASIESEDSNVDFDTMVRGKSEEQKEKICLSLLGFKEDEHPSWQEIKKRYVHLAKVTHSDKTKGDESEIKRLSPAYKLLNDIYNKRGVAGRSTTGRSKNNSSQSTNKEYSQNDNAYSRARMDLGIDTSAPLLYGKFIDALDDKVKAAKTILDTQGVVLNVEKLKTALNYDSLIQSVKVVKDRKRGSSDFDGFNLESFLKSKISEVKNKSEVPIRIVHALEVLGFKDKDYSKDSIKSFITELFTKAKNDIKSSGRRWTKEELKNYLGEDGTNQFRILTQHYGIKSEI